jgi:hypothetical protein
VIRHRQSCRESASRIRGVVLHGLHFRDASSAVGFCYGRATWIDAHGQRTRIATNWDGREIVLQVPGPVVDESAYPAVLDPVLGAEVDVGEPALGPSGAVWSAPLVSAELAGRGFLVVWHERSQDQTSHEIVGARISELGLPVGDPFVIADGTSWLETHVVAYGGAQYLVLWVNRGEDQPGLYGARVDVSGTVLDPGGFQILGGERTEPPAVAWSDERFLVVSRSLGGEVDAAWMEPDGTAQVLEDFSFAAASYPQDMVLASNGEGFLLVWEESNLELFQEEEIYGVRLSADAEILDPRGFAISNAAHEQLEPAVVWNGSHYFVVWGDNRDESGLHPYGARVASDGTLLDSDGIQLGSDAPRWPDGISASVAWDGTSFVVLWIGDDPDSRDGDALFSVRVSPEGEPRDEQSTRWPMAAPKSGPELGAPTAASSGNGRTLLAYSRLDQESGWAHRVKVRTFVDERGNGASCSVHDDCWSGHCVGARCQGEAAAGAGGVEGGAAGQSGAVASVRGGARPGGAPANGDSAGTAGSGFGHSDAGSSSRWVDTLSGRACTCRLPARAPCDESAELALLGLACALVLRRCRRRWCVRLIRAKPTRVGSLPTPCTASSLRSTWSVQRSPRLRRAACPTHLSPSKRRARSEAVHSWPLRATRRLAKLAKLAASPGPNERQVSFPAATVPPRPPLRLSASIRRSPGW